MTLNEWSAMKKLAIFKSLSDQRPPSEGEFSESVLLEGFGKGTPQIGTTVYEPDAARFEFIFSEQHSTATVLSVRVEAPERIVFLPVPSWVIETIWQGEIDGSYHFESEAMELVRAFESELAPEDNLKWFGPRAAKRRE